MPLPLPLERAAESVALAASLDCLVSTEVMVLEIVEARRDLLIPFLWGCGWDWVWLEVDVDVVVSGGDVDVRGMEGDVGVLVDATLVRVLLRVDVVYVADALDVGIGSCIA